MSPIQTHQIFSDSNLQFLNGSHLGTFLLICYAAHTDSHQDFMLHMYLFFTFRHKGNNATANYFYEIYEYFLKSHMLFTSLSHLNFMCFDIRAAKSKLCVVLIMCQNAKWALVHMDLFFKYLKSTHLWQTMLFKLKCEILDKHL